MLCTSCEIMVSLAILIALFCLHAFMPQETIQTNMIYTEHDSEGMTLAHLMARHIFSKRTRQAILEVDEAELEHLLSIEDNVAVLLQDDSKVNK